ncbi:uncharacterized protein LOC123510147 [Portunus trituberculatus]|uniref:uncharacterized protein LOC123510147 n=1 Tax=Portunus trituberculatus TaxID=210409 RepID=UPI001E1CF652|nr:uncharacterized protein LOC123510147 [Portunus trituberculatus]
MAGHTGRWPRPEVTLTASRRRGQGLSLWCGREARSWPAAATNPHSLGGLRYFRHVARQQAGHHSSSITSLMRRFLEQRTKRHSDTITKRSPSGRASQHHLFVKPLPLFHAQLLQYWDTFLPEICV